MNIGTLSLTTKIIILIIVIFILIIIWRKIGYKFNQLVQKKDITVLDGESTELPNDVQANLKNIAKCLHTDIENTSWTGHDYTCYKQALQLSDTELAFLAKYYKQYLGVGKTLWKSIDDDYYPTGNEPQQLQTRLASMGLR